MNLPALTTEQMAQVDRLMIEEYGILLIQMMENAGRNLAEQARRMLGGRVADRRRRRACGFDQASRLGSRRRRNGGADDPAILEVSRLIGRR